ncbi:hypothetical protein SAY87_020976 [Trapa incisa]|uniref:HMA domain-containing protein n=1 Tax=Trapa incisa TaxID=236973 RepID=A0AAN7PQR7_9MYRT|nr:hypothetical protein SAY87_020976 [Trapa incisa]
MELTIFKTPVSTSTRNPRLHLRISVPLPQVLSLLGSRIIDCRFSCIHNTGFRGPSLASVPAPPPSPSSYSLRTRGTPALSWKGSRCSPSSNSPSVSAGGGSVGSASGDAESNTVDASAEEESSLPSDVIVLNVGGMMCAGCASSVKKILESQPQVSSATVDLTAETATVWPVSEAKSVPNWQNEVGEALAKHLTNCSFTSTLRGDLLVS